MERPWNDSAPSFRGLGKYSVDAKPPPARNLPEISLDSAQLHRYAHGMPAPRPTDDTRPAVSVVMSVFNGLPYLEDAARSIMGQSLRDIEIILVDDASTDATPEVLARLAAEDARIRLHRMPQNGGISKALNAGVALARAPLIARMDADDIALPDRLARQKAVMDADPGLVLLGTSIIQIGPDGAILRTSLRPRDHVGLCWLSLFHTPFNHPSMMLRATPEIRPHLIYDSAMEPAEDFDLFSRLLALGPGRNMGEALLKYRVHPAQISTAAYRRQIETIARISRRMQAETLPPDIAAALAPLNAAYLDFQPTPPREVFAAMRALIRHSAAAHPGHRRFFRRHGAQIVATALIRSGHRKTRLPGLFAAQGRDFLVPLAGRFLETRGLAG